jgi:hypothetical protein
MLPSDLPDGQDPNMVEMTEEEQMQYQQQMQM